MQETPYLFCNLSLIQTRRFFRAVTYNCMRAVFLGDRVLIEVYKCLHCFSFVFFSGDSAISFDSVKRFCFFPRLIVLWPHTRARVPRVSLSWTKNQDRRWLGTYAIVTAQKERTSRMSSGEVVDLSEMSFFNLINKKTHTQKMCVHFTGHRLV